MLYRLRRWLRKVRGIPTCTECGERRFSYTELHLTGGLCECCYHKVTGVSR